MFATKVMANELSTYNIRVNSVVPGWVMTKRQIKLWLTPESEKDMIKKQCLKQKLMPAEISKADIKTKIAELQTVYDNNKYQRDRASKYPSIPDQLDKIYHEGIDEWKKVIKAVKDANPKE